MQDGPWGGCTTPRLRIYCAQLSEGLHQQPGMRQREVTFYILNTARVSRMGRSVTVSTVKANS